MKIRKLAMILIGVSLLLFGCSSDKTATESAPSENQKMDNDSSPSDNVTGESAAEEGSLTSSSLSAQTKVSTSKQKLIKDVYLQVETKAFDELLDCITQNIGELEGYIETSEINGSSYEYENTRYASLKVRMPNDKLNQFVLVVKENANIINKTESTLDVTLEYVDMESHIVALRAEQESLLKILEAATKLEDIIKIQSQLTQVRYEIESYESQLRTYDNLVSYSTISLEIHEVSRETKMESKTFGETIKSRLSDNLYTIGQGFQSFIIWFVSSIPYFLIWAVLLIPCILILRKFYKKFSKK